ncbi:hypothetical protein E6Q11_02730 [Candidatus Dojkabacteria bacterium]|uniref:Uncharacterized protein n=1 Tax=Candidatus Dojkabacteria bacterium TaxID=2099670 RepID=A0A5C7J883_9BACT|nr:MAG: hypothetical protein E6Q11_02730 [Candidatus Dojkabacteria bacterium]
MSNAVAGMTRGGELATIPQRQGNTELEATLRQMVSMNRELRRLRKAMSRQNRRSAIVNQAIVDAQNIIIEATVTGSTSQRSMERIGIGRRRWEWAVAFLRYAGVIAMRNHDWRVGLTWATDDPKEVLVLLNKAATELDDERGYKRLVTCRVKR